jgi:hypothetical protein
MDILALLPPGLRPYAKAVTPAALALAAAIVTAATTGQVAGLEVAVVGLLAASVTFGVDNVPVGLLAYAKSLAPAALTVVAVPVHFFVTGSWDAAEWTLAVTGLGSAVVAFLVPNELVHTVAVAVAAAHLDTAAPEQPDAVPLLADEQPTAMRSARSAAAAQDPPTRPAA